MVSEYLNMVLDVTLCPAFPVWTFSVTVLIPFKLPWSSIWFYTYPKKSRSHTCPDSPPTAHWIETYDTLLSFLLYRDWPPWITSFRFSDGPHFFCRGSFEEPPTFFTLNHYPPPQTDWQNLTESEGWYFDFASCQPELPIWMAISVSPIRKYPLKPPSLLTV